MPKELLPIIDRPIIQYAVEEALSAGITKLVFVTGRTKRAIADHFDAAPELERALEVAGKSELAAAVRDTLPPHVHAVYIRQRAPLGLRHAVLCARPAVGSEPFAVLLADDFITPALGADSPTAALSAAYAAAGLVEKPATGEEPSRLASIGRYVLHPEVFDVLASLGPGRGDEIQLADAIDALARRGRMGALPLDGGRHDCGSHLGYLGAIVAAASSHPEFGAEFRALMKANLSAKDGGG
jgi:UTP--glucose-1-phosphate uridylyltransferase